MPFIKLYVIYLINVPPTNSEIVKGYFIHDKFYLLHVWKKHNNKIYDIGYMRFLRNNEIEHLPYQLSIEEPKHLENMDDNYEEF